MSTSELPIRQAVRALILDPNQRVLLVRFQFTVGTVWALPGGGIEGDESPLEALRRELIEEVGLHEVEIGPFVWDMHRIIPEMAPNGWSGQRDLIHFVPTHAFDPAPTLSWEQMNSEGVHELRWWTPHEVASSEAMFAPRTFPDMLAGFLADGPPAEPLVIHEHYA
jgi:8-oxo-dGTP diphosphatase